MSQSFDLERIILHWKREYGTLTPSKKWKSEYYQIPINERFAALKILIMRIRDAGKPEEYFTNSRKDEIIIHCIPHEKSVTPHSHKMFKKGTADHLNMAITDVYSEASAKEIKPKEKAFTKEFDPTKVKYDGPLVEHVIDPEMAELLGYNDDEEGQP